ncbi:rhomboid family intramembrane serine protease [Tamlana haliotis]|uniref:Rhomboid family intramembrane serine protease n=1 Tax=Pseudotamlana haliotis TaxID=2614804 RepID=A0A6N6MHQ0_9FLAO|nr:rhomboid family intramembrane serine protease [Tamlana haliotis]KAB1067697.1 rhomboid family intramembrane serine protease [Tamlana haliotis]
MMRISETVKHLIIINVIMFVGTMFIGGGKLFYEWFAMYFPKNDAFRPWQIITHMFMHGSVTHILFNMFALWMFGSPVEQVLGSKKFLFIYISAGLGAVLLQIGFYYFQYIPNYNGLLESGLSAETIKEVIVNSKGSNLRVSQDQLEMFRKVISAYNASMVGASGCIMGIMAAFGMMNPEAKLMMIFLPIPIKAKYFIPGIILLDLISGLTGQSFFSPSNTAYMAHVGGALTGFFIMWYWKKNQFNQNRWD